MISFRYRWIDTSNPSIFYEIDTWGHFRLIGWQNKVDPRQERDLYKVPHWRCATTTRELSGSIKSLAISHWYDRAVLLCHVRRHRYKLLSLPYIYQSRQRGDVDIPRSIINKTWNPKHIRHSTPFYTASFFFLYIEHTSTCVPLHPSMYYPSSATTREKLYRQPFDSRIDGILYFLLLPARFLVPVSALGHVFDSTRFVRE